MQRNNNFNVLEVSAYLKKKTHQIKYSKDEPVISSMPEICVLVVFGFVSSTWSMIEASSRAEDVNGS